MSVILNLVGMDATTPINCQLRVSFEFFFCYTSAAAASLMIVLRIIAIWDRNMFAMTTAYSLLGIKVAFFIQSVARTRAKWAPARLACENDNMQSTLSLIATLVTDISLLLLMLVGLFRIRFRGVGRICLSHLFWRQGVLWLLIATAAVVPPAVFIGLGLDAQSNVVFQHPGLIMMAFAVTRMHRSFVDFATRTTNIFSAPEGLQKNIRTHSETKRARAIPTSNSPMVIMVYTDSEQLQTPQMSDQESSITMENQMDERVIELSADGGVERSAY